MAAPVFSLAQLSLMHASLRRSEGHVARGFHIPVLPSKQYPYEVVTLVDLQQPERAPQALAHLVIYERQRPSGPEHLYRICLQDDQILESCQEGGLDLLGPLLVYVLTHELVHVVRFQRADQSYMAEQADRQQEEEQVHLITLKLLADADEPGWRRLEELCGNPVIPARVMGSEASSGP